MSKKWIGTIKDGSIIYSEYVQYDLNDWMRENNGKKVRIEPIKNPVSDEMRGYYFSAVLPVIRTTCDEWAKLSTSEIHEIIKKMLFYFETYNPLTQRVERFGRSVMSSDDWNSTAKAMEFLEIINQYLADCGREMPDPEEYKRMRDSAPMN